MGFLSSIGNFFEDAIKDVGHVAGQVVEHVVAPVVSIAAPVLGLSGIVSGSTTQQRQAASLANAAAQIGSSISGIPVQTVAQGVQATNINQPSVPTIPAGAKIDTTSALIIGGVVILGALLLGGL